MILSVEADNLAYCTVEPGELMGFLRPERTRPVRKLSLGQCMKAELLAALLHQQALNFLDEPTFWLVVDAQARVSAFLAVKNRRTGATVLLIHHGGLFHDGRLRQLTNARASPPGKPRTMRSPPRRSPHCQQRSPLDLIRPPGSQLADRETALCRCRAGRRPHTDESGLPLIW